VSLPPVYRAVMLAGITSGQPGKSIEMLVDSSTRLELIRRVTAIALLYPIIVIAVTSLLFSFVVTSVVPRFDWLNQSHFGPFATLAHWPTTVIVAAFILPAVVVLAVGIWWWRSKRLGGTLSNRFGVLAWLPGARRVCRWDNAASFSETLLLLVENNVPLDQSLRLTAQSSGDAQLRAAAEQLAEQVHKGASAATENPKQIAAFPLMIRLALRHSDNRKLLTSSLQQAATMYRDRAMRAAEWYAEFVPIALTAVLGGTLTLGFTLLVLWPYASTLREIAGSNWR
jgi:general secretion pathway protein F